MLGHIVEGYRMKEKPDRPYFALNLRREATLLHDCAAH